MTRRHAGVDPEAHWDFRPGERVMTVDGYPGVVERVEDGPYPSTEKYIVVLDGGIGGGEYGTSQLSSLGMTTTAQVERTASDDYPELGSILEERPSPELAFKTGSLQTVAGITAPSVVVGRVHPNLLQTSTVVYAALNAIPGQFNLFGGASDEGATVLPLAFVTVDVQDRTVEMVWVHEDRRRMGLAKRMIQLAEKKHGPLGPSREFSPGGRAVWESLGREVPEGSRMESAQTGEGWAARMRMALTFDVDDDDEWSDIFAEDLTSMAKTAMGERWDNFVGEFLDDVNERMETPFDPSQQTSWCRFRDGRGHCMYPKELDKEGTKRAGYAVFVPFDRGPCKRGWNEQQHCEVAEPGPDSGHPNPYPDGTRSYDQGGQRWSSLVEAMVEPQEGPTSLTSEAAWSDIREKAKRIRAEGHIRIVSANLPYVVAEVRGTNDIYQTTMMFVPGTRQEAIWECGCKWAAYAWARSGRWKKYEGRKCAHALALVYEIQSRRAKGEGLTEDSKEPKWRDTEPTVRADVPSPPPSWRVR